MPQVHRFQGFTSAEVYDVTQTDGDIKDGDVLVVEDEILYGVLVEAWPTMVWSADGSPGEFHQLVETTSWQELDAGKYAASAALALELAPFGA